ncbi:hypothetical protein [Flavobacterium sp. RS13.1]|uniref:hypothetical protein n=1 Tax=Flavobacterium sp. RS13.1 TaxID=3400345 RepID=UPI003AAF0802
MKNTITKTFAILLLLVTAFTNFSCDNDDDTPTNLLVGKWYWVSTSYPKEKASSQKATISQSVISYIEFKTDGVYEEGYETGSVASSYWKTTYTKTETGYTIADEESADIMKIKELTSDKLVTVDEDGTIDTYTKTASKATNVNEM